MTEPPRQSVFDDIAHVRPAGGYAGNRSNMVGFQRMLHPEQKTETQNSEHMLPDFNRSVASVLPSVAPLRQPSAI
jgi:hypothetical protein